MKTTIHDLIPLPLIVAAFLVAHLLTGLGL